MPPRATKHDGGGGARRAGGELSICVCTAWRGAPASNYLINARLCMHMQGVCCRGEKVNPNNGVCSIDATWAVLSCSGQVVMMLKKGDC